MKKTLQALVALLFAVPTFLFAQIPTPCGPPGIIEPAENCYTTCVACEFSTYTGSTGGWQGDPQPPAFCSNIQNDQWIAFVATTDSATITINPSDCVFGQGIQAAVFAAECDEMLTCNPACATCGNTVTVLDVVGMTIGRVYYLVIDGYSGDICNFTLNVSPAQSGINLTLPITPAITGASLQCTGVTSVYSIDTVANAGYYEWSSSTPGVLFNGQEGSIILEGPMGTSVEVTMPAFLGAIQVCVTPMTPCTQGSTRCKVINIQGLPPTILPDVAICAEDIPYTLPWGETVSTSGTYSVFYPSSINCDSIVRQKVTVYPEKNTTLVEYICGGEQVEICGTAYNTSGNYEIHCNSVQGCDSMINLILTVLAPVANIIEPAVQLSCVDTALTLISLPSPAGSIKIWTDLTTGITTNDSVLAVSHPGFYQLCTYLAAGNGSCQQCDTIYVAFDSLTNPPPPLVSISGEANCVTFAKLKGVPTFPAISFAWDGPQGFHADTNFVSVNVSGTYTFTVNGAGCSSSATIEVVADVAPPVVTFAVSHTTNGQNNGAVEVDIFSGTPPYTYVWVYNGAVISNEEDIANLAPGLYTLTVTGSNGCTHSVTVQVNGSTVGVQDLSEEQSWSVSPNPASSLVQLLWKGTTLPPETTIACYDVSGKLIYQRSIAAGQTATPIDCSLFPQGVYVLEITPVQTRQKSVLRFEIIR
jgi:Secretion system C-terminal sorting domain/PKD-like domain